jgi:antitoxin ParD1/3/4
MERKVQLSDSIESFLEHVVASGRYASADKAIEAALELLETRETKLAQLQALLDEGFDDLENGRYVEYSSENMHELTEDIRRRGMERLKA